MFSQLLKNRKDHPLEKYILAIDNYLDDDIVLRSIADRIGISVPDREYAVYVLYDGLEKYLLEEVDPKVTENIINISFEDYKKYLEDISELNKNLSEDELNILYYNRLLEKN